MGRQLTYLAVWPWFPESYWSFRRAFAGFPFRAAIAPLPILTVAGAAPSDVAWRLWDENVSGRLRPELLSGVDAVFLSGMLVQWRSINRVIALARAAGVPTVLGGPCATQEPHRFPGADHILLGELEGAPESFFAAVRERGRSGHGPQIYHATPMPDVLRAAIPRFDLVKPHAYMSHALQFSRGCPFNCEFCDIIEIYGRRPRTKSNEQMLAEMDSLLRSGFRGSVFLVDDNFIGNLKAAERLLPAIERWQHDHHFPFTFYTEASVNLAEKPDLMRAMTRAGFNAVFCGIESPDEATLQQAQKRQNTARDLRESVRLIEEAGLEVRGGFIVGFDGEDEGVFERQRQFIQDAAIPLAMVGTLRAPPGTQLMRRMEREARLLEEPPEAEGDQFNLPNFQTTMDSSVLMSGYGSLLRSVYEPDAYFERVVELLRRLGKSKPARLGRRRMHTRRPYDGRLRSLIRVVVDMHRSYRAAHAFWKGLIRVTRMGTRKLGKYIAFASVYRHLAGYTEEEILPRIETTLEALRRGEVAKVRRSAGPPGGSAGAAVATAGQQPPEAKEDSEPSCEETREPIAV